MLNILSFSFIIPYGYIKEGGYSYFDAQGFELFLYKIKWQIK